MTTKIVHLNEIQCLTAAASLGITLLMLFQKHMPEHKKVAKKIKVVEEAITDLYCGTGQNIDMEVAEHFLNAWDLTMMEMTIYERGEYMFEYQNPAKCDGKQVTQEQWDLVIALMKLAAGGEDVRDKARAFLIASSPVKELVP